MLEYTRSSLPCETWTPTDQNDTERTPFGEYESSSPSNEATPEILESDCEGSDGRNVDHMPPVRSGGDEIRQLPFEGTTGLGKSSGSQLRHPKGGEFKIVDEATEEGALPSIDEGPFACAQAGGDVHPEMTVYY